MFRLFSMVLGLLLFSIYCMYLFTVSLGTNVIRKYFEIDLINKEFNHILTNVTNMPSNSCQEIFTTPILKKFIMEKLDYQKSLPYYQYVSKRKTHIKANSVFTFGPYEAIAKTLPPLITENLEPLHSMPQILDLFPWLKCELRHYAKGDAEICGQGPQAPRVLLVGDSRVREIVFQLLVNWQNLYLTVNTQRGPLTYEEYVNTMDPETKPTDVSWLGAKKKDQHSFILKSDINVTAELAPRLSIKYIFSAFLTSYDWIPSISGLHKMSIVKKQKRKSILQVLQQQLETLDDYAPKLLILGTGTWTIKPDLTSPEQPELLRNLDWLLQSITYAGAELEIILQRLKKKGVSVVWILPDNVKVDMFDLVDDKPLYRAPAYEFFFEWINEILLNTLIHFHDQDLVTIWDSNHIISSKVLQACRQLLRSQKSGPKELGLSPQWGCGDIVHSGPQAAHRYAQIIFNYICNDQYHMCCGDRENMITNRGIL